MNTRVENCRCCGSLLEFPEGLSLRECPSCGTLNALPDDRVRHRADFKNARELQSRGEFCDAEASYQRVLDDIPDDADALWGRLLCHYGAKLEMDKNCERRYTVDLPRSRPMRAQGDFDRACTNAAPEMRQQYEQDAAYIDNVMERIRTRAAGMPHYDIFICHKTSPLQGGGVTEDYVRARDLRDLLIREGYRVFFAPVDMEGIVAGEGYEAGIYHALHTAKVMLVVCSDIRHLNATWVRSEWERFLTRRDEGEGVALIPLLYGMRPEQLPRAFDIRHLQAIKMELSGKDTLLSRLQTLIPRKKPVEVKPVQPVAPPKPAPVPPAPKPAPPKKKRKSLLAWVLALCLIVTTVFGGKYVYEEVLSDREPEGQELIVDEVPAVPVDAPTETPTEKPTPVPTPAAKNVEYVYYEMENQGTMACLDVSWDNDDTEWDISWRDMTEAISELVTSKDPVRVKEETGRAFLPIGSTTAFWGRTYEFFIYPKGDAYNGLTSYRFEYTFPDGPAVTPSPTPTEKPTPAPSLKPSSSTLNFSAASGTQTIRVDANCTWSVSDNASWITVTKKSDSVEVKVTENTSTTASRTGKITFEYGNTTRTVTVEQGKATPTPTPAPSLKPSSSTLVFTAASGTKTIEVDANCTWSVSANRDWITVTEKNGSVEVKVTENTSTTASRTGKITFEYGNATKTVTVEQKKIECVTTGKVVGDYTIDVYSNNTCEIVDYTGEETALSIPQILGGYRVTSIGERVFYNCDSLKSVTIPNNVMSIGEYAFADCNSLKSISISESVTTIEEGTFMYCYALTSIKIPDGVESIGDVAFGFCIYLTSVDIPDSMVSIGAAAFRDCHHLERIEIPNGVTSIGQLAFCKCYNLKSIKIPASVTNIGYDVFIDCSIVTLAVTPNSYAETYAKENDIPYTYAN